MPGWLSVVVGLIAAITLIAGAVYLAVRPYLRHDLMPGARKPWMPDSTGRKSDTGGPTGEDLIYTHHHDRFL